MSAPVQRRPFLWRAAVYLLKALMPLLVLAGAAAGFIWMIETAPQAERQVRPRLARLVEVIAVEPGPQQVVLRAQGTVRAAQEVTLRAQVTGEVIWTNPALEPGGILGAGETLLRIDPRDFELAVAAAESRLAEALAELAVEAGNQRVGEREYSLLGRDLSPEERALVLRAPQLAMAEARVARERAALATARLDLERSEVRAPFDAQVLSEDIDTGSRIATTSQEIARLTGTGHYWVELALPQSDLAWLGEPGAGAEGARVTLRQPGVWPPGATREGRVLRLLSDLTGAGRMARILVEVPDPLALTPANAGRPQLLIGQYLQAEIVGRSVPGAVALDRQHLRGGDTVWLMTPEDTLAIVPVEVAWRGPDRAIVTAGIPADARLVTTDIAAVSAGMPLRLATQTPAEQGADAQAPAAARAEER